MIAALLILALSRMAGPLVGRLERLTGLDNQPDLPVSTATYDEVDRAVGCRSGLSADEKDATFRRDYRDRWMNWGGEIAYIKSGEIDVRLRSTSDAFELQVFLADRRAAARKALTDQIKLQFVLRRRGDCGKPYQGDSGRVGEGG